MPLPAYVAASIATCTKPPTSKAKEDKGPKSPSVTVPYMLGARTTVKCVTGMARLATTSRNATPLAIANTVYDVAMMELTVFAPMTSAMSSKTAKSILLTPTSSAATVLLLTMTLTSKGH